ncbi:MAG TPA: sulfatase [Myxococcota bacterium]|nr:sulfatase [Myxococcota bacterium]
MRTVLRAGMVFLFMLGAARAGGVPGDEQPQGYFPGFARQPLGAGAVSEIERGKPIIWVVIDALRPNHLGCYGYHRPTSPALDRFADQGLVFTRFFANSSWTRTATTSMLTGLLPSNHGVQCEWHKLQAGVGTLAERLEQAGYATLAVVGNGNASSAFGLDRGFDVFEDTTTNWKGLPVARQVFELGLKHLKRHKGEDKVFLFLFVVDPHDPYRPAPPYDTMFRPNYHGKVIDSPSWEYNNDYPAPVRRKIVALYDGEIRYTDRQFENFFAGLRKLGFYDRSTILITADHGESLGEHGVYKHAYHHYETHIHIPLLIRAPWLKDMGKYTSLFAQQVDLFPTLCDLAGAKIPDGLDGMSLLAGLRDGSRMPVPRYSISEYVCYGIRRYSIRTRAYKLVYQRPADRAVFMKYVKNTKFLPSTSFDKETFLLFDMLSDPHEEKDCWAKRKDTLGRRLLKVLEHEIDDKLMPKKVKDVDPALVEELRSIGYVQ